MGVRAADFECLCWKKAEPFSARCRITHPLRKPRKGGAASSATNTEDIKILQGLASPPVFQLVKIQDLVVRLLHENFEGKLVAVNYDADGWERDLSMEEAKNGLKALFDNLALSEADYRSILTALAEPAKSQHRKVVIDYSPVTSFPFDCAVSPAEADRAR
jgi:hypothetical protein